MPADIVRTMRRLVFLAVLTMVVAACSGSGGSTASGKNSSFCNLSRNFGSNLNLSGSGDLKAKFQQFDSMVSQFQSQAPAEIKADVNTLVGAVRQFEDSVKSHNYTVDPSYLAPFSDPKLTQASTRIADYDTRVCGITAPTTPTT